MSKTISDEEYERLTKRDGQVDEYIRDCGGSNYGWCEIFEATAKPKQYRPTLDELVEVYADTISVTGNIVSRRCKQGLKAVIDKVYQGMSEEYTETPKAYYNISMQHRQGYKED